MIIKELLYKEYIITSSQLMYVLTKNKRLQNLIVGASLGLGESSIGEIIEWWQSNQQTNMAYLRVVY